MKLCSQRSDKCASFPKTRVRVCWKLKTFWCEMLIKV